MVELVYTTDLKSVAFWLEGSNPSAATNFEINMYQVIINPSLQNARLTITPDGQVRMKFKSPEDQELLESKLVK
jgi:hypothetical protein